MISNNDFSIFVGCRHEPVRCENGVTSSKDPGSTAAWIHLLHKSSYFEDIWSKTSLVLEFFAIKLSEYFTILRDTLVRTIILPQLKLASVKMRGKQRGLGE